MTKPLTHEEMLELAEQREKENAFNAFNALDRLYDENDEALRRLAINESEDRIDFPKQETENPDEIIVTDVSMVHFERMDDGFLWCGIYRKSGQIDHLNITTKGKKLSVLWTPATGHTNPNHSLNK